MTIELRTLTRDNFREIVKLQVAPGQEHFVASNLYSVAEARVNPDWVPLGLYAGGQPVGFLMHGRDPDEGRDWVMRLMIAADHQRQGYGRAAMQAAIGEFRAAGHLGEVFISYEPENEVARRLYASLGFEETGEMVEGETVARLRLDGEERDR
jgi:diamine N-acetyltransferase